MQNWLRFNFWIVCWFRSNCFAYMSGIWIDVIRESFLFRRLVIESCKFPTFFSSFPLKIETVDDLGVKTVRICPAKWLLFPEEGIIENEICTYESSRKFVDILSILSIWCIFWQHNLPSCISFILRIKTFCSGYFIKDIFGSEITQCQSILNDTLRNLTRNWHTK